ncbi:MAG: YdeI/OmpD-associated family protein [Ignavibacteria bacterium]|nr:YdeI/OmpD-associated family protein [Ignavibacteria bacterium]
MKPVFFSNQLLFRKWLEKNHSKEKELIVGFYKVSTGKPSLTWSQSVDEALCYGWIDGVRNSIDEESYSIRFTPRNPKSNWSLINLKKVEELKKKGLMRAPGLEVHGKRVNKSADYSYEISPLSLTDEFGKQFRKNKKAWDWFSAMPTSYRKVTVKWVMTAKQETTKQKRLDELISDSAAGMKIKAMRFGDKK